MRILAVGDIHGCFRSLSLLAETVPFTDEDLVVTLGDYVDRGPDSKSVVEWVMQRTELGRCLPLQGNHEIMMLAALTGRMPMQHWLQFGGREALDSYAPSGRRGSSDDVPLEHLRFLHSQLHWYYETDSHIFVHAGLAPDVPMEEQQERDLFWERFDFIAPHNSGKKIVCGHTAQKSGVPDDVGFAVCIDTWVYGQGWLTCLDVASGEYWQANEEGESRTGRLG